MNRALLLLIGFRHLGGWRSFWRSGRGSVIALLGKVLILCYLGAIGIGWLLGVWLALTTPRDSSMFVAIRSAVEENARLAPFPILVFLLFIGVVALFQDTCPLSPPEVNFLRAGPFSRRQLLGFKLGAVFSGLVVLALLAAPLGTVIAPLLSSFLGVLLLLNFFHLFTVLAGSLGTLLGLNGAKGPIRMVFGLAAFFVAFGLYWVSFDRVRVGDPLAMYRAAAQSPGWRLVLAPLRWFVEVVLAKRVWPDLVGWSSLCLLLDGSLLVMVDVLDARRELREDNADRLTADAAAAQPAAERVRRSLPLSTSRSGLRPIAWRQAMNVIRKPQQIAIVLIMHAMLIITLYVVVCEGRGFLVLPTLDGHLEVNPAGAWICGLLALLLPMLVASGLSFDFRGDMGQMDVLKALPIASLPLVAGQLIVPVVIAAVMQWLAMAIIALALRSAPPGLWIAAAFVPPVSLVLMAIENLPSFWFPLRRTTAPEQEPFELLGHVLLHPIVRMAGYVLASGTTVVAAALAFFMFGGGVAAAVLAAWLTLAATGAGLVALLAYTFDHFDVTQDAPA